MRLHLLVLLCFPIVGVAFQSSTISPLGDYRPLRERIYLDSAQGGLETARQLESEAQWQPALANYTRVIEDAKEALRSNPGITQDPTTYYVLGLAEADSARMFRYLQVSHLFEEQYRQHLQNAEQALATAGKLYQQRGQSVWPIAAALASVHILQGDFNAAKVNLQEVQRSDPAYRAAQEATNRFNSSAPGLAQVAAALRSRITSITPDQWKTIENFAKAVALALVPPSYVKTLTTGVTIASAGITFYREWQQTRIVQP